MKQKTFIVTFTEIVTRKVTVKANDEDDAVNKATYNENVVKDETTSEEQEIKIEKA